MIINDGIKIILVGLLMLLIGIALMTMRVTTVQTEYDAACKSVHGTPVYNGSYMECLK